jgi:hypothetical protein
MLQLLKQARAALSLLNPEAVRNLALRQVRFGLVSSSRIGFEEMEDFLIPRSLSHEERIIRSGFIHRAGDPNPPENVDFVLYEEGLTGPKGTYVFYREDPNRTIAEIVSGNDDISLPLARQYPAFRRAVVDRVIQSVARENAFFAVATALPDVVPSMIELPWAFGEWASDTAFLTANQFRMAFQIAAACGGDVGFMEQKVQILAIAGGAFGWRAIARELVGKIPLGGGLIPKGAIAYAGTYVTGKALEKWHSTQQHLAREERRQVYAAALERGRDVAQGMVRQ